MEQIPDPQDEVPEQQLPSPENNQSIEDKFLKLVGDELPEDSKIKEVVAFCINSTYSACETDMRASAILDEVFALFERDYTVKAIDNQNAALSYFYPARIPFVIKEKNDEGPDDLPEETSALLYKAYRARCRERFPVPVIFYQGRTICRSSTLAGVGEILARSTLDKVTGSTRPPPPTDSNIDEILAEQGANIDCSSFFPIIDELQIADIAYLKKLKVGAIFDLMVENRKHKMGIPVTSSEKVESHDKYFANFNVMSIPFPGCEFFKKFYENNFCIKGLHYDWPQPMCDADLSVNVSDFALEINWSEYREWEVAVLNRNYLKYILKYFEESDSGILVHCISGWDRTPLFISLLRLSLWADGLIHKSLTVADMLFFTLAYDWMLFGHHLTDRLVKSEDILLYCFCFLRYLEDDSCSIAPKMYPASEAPSINVSISSDCDRTLKNDERDNSLPPLMFEADGFSSIGDTGPPSVSSGGIPSPIPMDVLDSSSTTSSLKRTSPIEIPSPRASKRRPGSNISNASSNYSAYAMVSITGSIRGSDSQSDSPHLSQSSQSKTERSSKLSEISRLFFRCYYNCNGGHIRYVDNSGILKSIFQNLLAFIQPTPQLENL